MRTLALLIPLLLAACNAGWSEMGEIVTKVCPVIDRTYTPGYFTHIGKIAQYHPSRSRIQFGTPFGPLWVDDAALYEKFRIGDTAAINIHHTWLQKRDEHTQEWLRKNDEYRFLGLEPLPESPPSQEP